METEAIFYKKLHDLAIRNTVSGGKGCNNLLLKNRVWHWDERWTVETVVYIDCDFLLISIFVINSCKVQLSWTNWRVWLWHSSLPHRSLLSARLSSRCACQGHASRRVPILNGWRSMLHRQLNVCHPTLRKFGEYWRVFRKAKTGTLRFVEGTLPRARKADWKSETGKGEQYEL